MVKKNCRTAAFWYQKAAFAGDEEAKGHLETFFDKHKKKKKC
jgi:TPR repeat protein